MEQKTTGENVTVSKVEKRIKDLLAAVGSWSHKKQLMEQSLRKKSHLYRRHIEWESVHQILCKEIGYTDYSLEDVKKDFQSVCKVVIAEKTLDTIISEADTMSEKIARKEMTTGFKIFCAEKTSRYRKRFPNYEMTKIFKKVSDEWNTLSHDKKDVYTQKATQINEQNGFTKTPSRKRPSSQSLKRVKFPASSLHEFYMVSYLVPSMKGTLKDNKTALVKQAKEEVLKLDSKKLSKLEQQYSDCKKQFVTEFEQLSSVEKQLARGQFLSKKNIVAFSQDPVLGYLFDDSKEKPVFDMSKLTVSSPSKSKKTDQFHDVKQHDDDISSDSSLESTDSD